MTKLIVLFDFAGTLVNMRPARLLVEPMVLQQLSEKFRLVIATGASRSETINILNKLQISKLFDLIITASDTKYQKPETGLITNFIKSDQIAAYFGDSLKDYQLAQALNIPFYYIGKLSIGVQQDANINNLINCFYNNQMP
jgi:phosphoglycolate phosphatase-like HAD superfamily hydrolase